MFRWTIRLIGRVGQAGAGGKVVPGIGITQGLGGVEKFRRLTRPGQLLRI